jgi:hypothetical protein
MTIFITIKILDIIHRPVFYLSHNVSETGFCQTDTVSSLQTGTSKVDWVLLSSCHLMTETESNTRNFSFEIYNRTMDNVQNLNSYIYLLMITSREYCVQIITFRII